MRSRRFSTIAGWLTVALVAAIGFAAFGTPAPSADDVLAEAAAASIGHTAGAYAGLGFALAADEPLTGVPIESDEDQTAVAESTDTDNSSGTIVSPSTGWLSEVEVRELVRLYFEPTDVNRAVGIAWCESRFDPNHNDLRTGGVGLFNHLPAYWLERVANAGFEGADMTDPEASTAAAAWEVYNGAGWEFFNCR